MRSFSRTGLRATWNRDDRVEGVVVLKLESGLELNLLDSAGDLNHGRNVLTNERARYPGFAHVAPRVDDVARTAPRLRALGIALTEGPVTFADGSTSVFIRDLDRNVVEFSQPDRSR